jgi:phage-related protein
MMGWTVGFVNALAQAELDALPLDMRTRFTRFGDMLEARGIEAMREPYAKHLSGKLWELRLKGRDGIARSIYVTASGQRLIVLRTFVKKTEKTPPRELDIALARMKEIRE